MAIAVFDADDIDGAFADLDARYPAGEAAAQARTWWVIAQNNAAFNRREVLRRLRIGGPSTTVEGRHSSPVS
jgi:hypothetical protein